MKSIKTGLRNLTKKFKYRHFSWGQGEIWVLLMLFSKLLMPWLLQTDALPLFTKISWCLIFCWNICGKFCQSGLWCNASTGEVKFKRRKKMHFLCETTFPFRMQILRSLEASLTLISYEPRWWHICSGMGVLVRHICLCKKKNFLGYYWKHAISFPSVGCSLILSADVFFSHLILYFTLEVFSLLLGFYLILFQLWFLSCWGKILQ